MSKQLREAIERCREQLRRDRAEVRVDVQVGWAGCLIRQADIDAICTAAEATLPRTRGSLPNSKPYKEDWLP